MNVGYVRCILAYWTGIGEEGKFCAGPGLVHEGARLCDEPLPTQVYWSSHIVRMLPTKHRPFRRIRIERCVVTVLVDLEEAVEK